MSKMSIRFYKDHKVRAVWDEEHNHWWFSVLDIVGAINQQDDHEKNRNYWKYLKSKLRKEQSEVVSDTTQLKLTASDGKKYKTDVISQAGVDKLAKAIRNQQAMARNRCVCEITIITEGIYRFSYERNVYGGCQTL